MFCMNCGSQLPDGSKFCLNCGTAVQQEADTHMEKTIELPKIQPPVFTEVTRETLKEKQAQFDARASAVQQEAPPAAAVAAPQTSPAPTAAQAVQLQRQTPVVQEGPLPVQEAAPKAANVRRNVIILVVVLVLLVAAGAAAVFAVSAVRQRQADELLTTAEQYLSDAEYEQAVLEFEKLLEIDPYNVDAYLSMAEALTALGREDEARDILNEAADKLKDKDDLDKISNALEELGAEETAESAQTTEVTATTAATTAASSATTATTAAPTEESVVTVETSETAETIGTIETAETAETFETSETDENGIVYGDPEALAVETMLMDYLVNGGELDTSMLSEVTEFRYYYEKYVCVVMGNRGGTRLDVERVSISPYDVSQYTLVMADGTYDSYVHQDERVHDFGWFTDISFLEYMPHLRRFVTCGSMIEDLTPLTALEELEEVEFYLGKGMFGYSAFADIRNLRSLTLHLSGSIYDNASLSELTQIEVLDLGSFGTTDDIDLAALTQLKELRCCSDDLSVFAGMQSLEKLTVHPEADSPADAARADVTTLSQLPQLRELTLGCYSGIDNIALLAQMPQLEVFRPEMEEIDPTVFETFTNLKKLDLSGCYNVTEEQADALRQKLPDCEIILNNLS